MTSTANVLLRMHGGDIQINLKDDETFSVISDPKGLIDKDAGTWEFIDGVGTNLYLILPAEKYIFGVLLQWNLKDAKKGQSGEFNPTAGLAYGFDVTAVA